MLSAIGRALGLTEPERSYLHQLAGQLVPTRPGPARDVRPGVLRLLDRLDDIPALVCDAKYDVLAWNVMAVNLLGDFGKLAPNERNVVRRFFTDPAVRARHDPSGAAEFARESVADLRAAAARYPDDPAIHELIDELARSSAEFRQLWERQDVTVRRFTSKRLHHPSLGWLDLDREALHDPDQDHWIIVYTAALGTPAHEALKLLKVIGTQQLSTDSR
jgi:MmyB-like transcription regulator ligand binding domain